MFELLWYQLECVSMMLAAYVKGTGRALVDMASGLGKTVVTAAFTLQVWNQAAEAGMARQRVLFLAEQEEHLTQARDTMLKHLPKHTYGFLTGTEKDWEPVHILYATFQTVRNHLEKFPADAFQLVVVDEAHHAKADTYEPVIRHFSEAFWLGLTATPDRMDLRDIREIFGDPVYSLPLPKALAVGDVLAKVDYRVMFDHLGDFEQIRRLVAEKGMTLSQLNRVFFIPRRDEEIADEIIKCMSEQKDPKVMVFCRNVEHLTRFSRVLARRIDGVTTLYNGLSKKQRDANLEAFKAGKKKVLCAIDMLNEGVDVPDATTLVFLRSTESYTIFVQQLGRGLRRLSPGIAKRVVVLDFVGSWERIKTLCVLRGAVNAECSGPDAFEITAGEFDFTAVSKDVFEILKAASPYWTDQKLLDALQGAIDAGLTLPIINTKYLPFAKNHPELDLPGWFALTARKEFLEANGITFGTLVKKYSDAQVLELLERAKAAGLRLPINQPAYRDFAKAHPELRLPSWSAIRVRMNFLEANGITLEILLKKYSDAQVLELMERAKATGLRLPVNSAAYKNFSEAHPELDLPRWSVVDARQAFLKANGFAFEKLHQEYSDAEMLKLLESAKDAGLSLPLSLTKYTRFAEAHPELSLPTWATVNARRDFLQANGIAFKRPVKRYSDRQVLELLLRAKAAGLQLPISNLAYERFAKAHPELSLPSWPTVRARKDFLQLNGVKFK